MFCSENKFSYFLTNENLYSVFHTVEYNSVDEDRNMKKTKSKESASYLMQKLNEQKNRRLGVSLNAIKSEYQDETGLSRNRVDDEM